LDRITYRAIIEHPTPDDCRGLKLVEFTKAELVDKIVAAGDGWSINHADKCFPPYKDGNFKKVVSVTDDIRATVAIKRLKKEG
tara:strand:- start:42 stop:290 length:249 start_codon:yes stop_codon:yes gene_type:complete